MTDENTPGTDEARVEAAGLTENETVRSGAEASGTDVGAVSGGSEDTDTDDADTDGAETDGAETGDTETGDTETGDTEVQDAGPQEAEPVRAAPARRTRGRRVTTGVTTPRPAEVPPVDHPQGQPEHEPAPAVADAPAPPTDQPDAGAPVATEDGPVAAQVGPVATPDGPVAAAPVRRSRRATSAGRVAAGGAGGVDQAPSVEPATGTEAAAPGDPAPDPAAADATAPKARTARGRGRGKAKTTAPADAPDGEAGTDQPVADQLAPDTAAAPETDASGTESIVTDAVESDATAPDRTDDTGTPTAPAAASQAAPLDVLAELGSPREPARPTTESPRLATTALLFQAPDPARTRRRRAQAPAGPPRVDEAASLPAEDEADESAEATDGSGEDGRDTGRSRRTSRRRRDRAPESQADTPEEDGAAGDESAEDATDQDSDEGDDTDETTGPRRRRRRGGRGRRSRSGGNDRADDDSTDGTDDDGSGNGDDEDSDEGDAAVGSDAQGRSADDSQDDDGDDSDDSDDDTEGNEDGQGGGTSSRRRRRRRRSSRGEGDSEEAPAPASRTRQRAARPAGDEVTALKGSTRLEAKRQRRREGRDSGRRRTIVSEAEFLARRESVDRSMVVREANGRVQIAVLEDGVLVEHFVSRSAQNAQSSMAGNVYLGRVQNVLPSMEAAFVDVGKGRNAVLYAGEVNWDAAGLEGQPRRIEQALKSGDSVLVQVTKDPIGHKGARLTSQITLAGRYLVYVPGGGMTGISRKLPENERARLKKLLKEIVPEKAGVIVRTAAEGASEEELRRDVQRLQDQWAAIEKKAKSASAPALLQGEPDMAIRVVRDIFNDDFRSLVVQGDEAWSTISEYVAAMAPDLAERASRWEGDGDVFAEHRIDEQLAKGMERKVWLPSGGSLVIDRTEAMTVVDVNTGKFTGSGGTLEETVTRNNLEAAEEIVRQLRLRDIGGIIVIDFIDMVLESNRDLVLRRLVECLGRDRTKHQVAEVTSLGLVQMTRKRVGQGLVEAFSETCPHCNGRGFIVHDEPVEARPSADGEPGRPAPSDDAGEGRRSRRKKSTPAATAPVPTVPVLPEAREAVKATLATIAAAAAHAHEHGHDVEAAVHDVVGGPGTVEIVLGDVVDVVATAAVPSDGVPLTDDGTTMVETGAPEAEASSQDSEPSSQDPEPPSQDEEAVAVQTDAEQPDAEQPHAEQTDAEQPHAEQPVESGDADLPAGGSPGASPGASVDSSAQDGGAPSPADAELADAVESVESVELGESHQQPVE